MFEGLLQPIHVAVLLVIALIVFGPGKIGDLGGQLGRSVREFRETAEGRTPPALPAGRTCPACGTRIAADASYCTTCGRKLEGSAA